MKDRLKLEIEESLEKLEDVANNNGLSEIEKDIVEKTYTISKVVVINAKNASDYDSIRVKALINANIMYLNEKDSAKKEDLRRLISLVSNQLTRLYILQGMILDEDEKRL